MADLAPLPDERSLLQRLWALVVRGILLILFGVALWFPGLVWYTASMPDVVEDPLTPTDVIVVLTGGSERLKVGLSLLKDGRAPLLFVSGVNPETTLDALLQEEAPLPAGLRNRILLGHVAGDTVGNAIETAVWLRAHHMDSLRLVTASYHMPRSLLEFQAALPRARIIAHPVFPASVKQDSWWTYPGTAGLFISEYNKYLVARLRLMLPDGPQEALNNSHPPAPSQGTSLPPLARITPPEAGPVDQPLASAPVIPLEAHPVPPLPTTGLPAPEKGSTE